MAKQKRLISLQDAVTGLLHEYPDFARAEVEKVWQEKADTHFLKRKFDKVSGVWHLSSALKNGGFIMTLIREGYDRAVYLGKPMKPLIYMGNGKRFPYLRRLSWKWDTMNSLKALGEKYDN